MPFYFAHTPHLRPSIRPVGSWVEPLFTETMTNEPTPVPAPQPSLRKAALEVLLAATIANEHWTNEASDRLKKALEQLAEELGK